MSHRDIGYAKFNSEMSQQISVCIPRVDSSTTKDYVKQVFNNVLSPSGADIVASVDLVTKVNEKGEEYKRVFIHFMPWEMIDSSIAKEIYQKLISGVTIKIMHSAPYYWKCSMNRQTRPTWLSNQQIESINMSQ